MGYFYFSQAQSLHTTVAITLAQRRHRVEKDLLEWLIKCEGYLILRISSTKLLIYFYLIDSLIFLRAHYNYPDIDFR